MGNSKSSQKYMDMGLVGYIIVKLEKEAYELDEIIRGHVYLSIFQRFPGNQISIQLVKQEQLHLNNKNKLQSGKLVQQTYTLQISANNFTEIGEYNYNFQLPLQQNFQQSQFIQSTEQRLSNYASSLLYYIEANLKSLDKNVSDLETVGIFRVLPQLNQFNLELSMKIMLNSCWQKYGHGLIKLTVDKNIFCKGDTINAFLLIDNRQSQMDLVKLNISLVQYISFIQPDKEIIIKKSIIQSVNEMNKQQVKKHLTKEDVVNIQIPNNIQPTFKGQFYVCLYQLQIDANYSENCSTFKQIQAVDIHIIDLLQQNAINNNRQLRYNNSNQLNNDQLKNDQINLDFNNNEDANFNNNQNLIIQFN